MEMSDFGLEPRIPTFFQNSPLIGVCAIQLERAGITGAGRCTIRLDPAMVVCSELYQLVAGRTLKIVQLAKVDESREAIVFCSRLRAARQQCQKTRDCCQEESINQCQKHFDMH